MAEFTEYAPGTPAWIDLGAKDVAAAATFYSELFGWEAEDLGEEAGHYTMMKLRGKHVAAVGPLMSEMQPVAWSTYLATDDADATAKKVKDAGGTVIAEPFDVFGSGRMAVFLDPTGAAVLTWQAKEHKGAELANEPNTLVWSELRTTDMDKAKAFYKAAFDLDTEPFPGMDYTMVKVGDHAIGGMVTIGEGMVPEGTPPHWNVIFAVEDADAIAAKAEKLGGKVVAKPSDMPGVGRFASIADPQGGTFTVMKGEQPAETPS